MKEKKIKLTEEREDWIDILKFLGIFAIYIGHCGQNAGKIYPFVFIYHVPLFFFVSGFFANKYNHLNIIEYIYKKINTLLLPYIIYSLLSIISYAILQNLNLSNILNIAFHYLLGIRNTLVSGGLWFIPCMFLTCIIYFVVNKIVKNKKLVFIIITVLFIITQTIMPNNPLEKPSWFFNLDSSMYYILYYCLGDILFNNILSMQFNKFNLSKKIAINLISVISIIIFVISYFKGADFLLEKLITYMHFEANITIIKSLYYVLITIMIINVNILIAKILKNIKLLQILGSSTLSLCGTEDIIKLYINVFLSMFGITIVLNNPLACVFYTFICLIISYMFKLYIIDKINIKNISINAKSNLYINDYEICSKCSNH